MKWNAIITKSQYEKAVLRAAEINRSLPGACEKDELLLLTILIKDYEQRHAAMTTPDAQKQKTFAGSCYGII
jgi:HTH-type transcriptional regulator/antitoxin HigA